MAKVNIQRGDDLIVIEIFDDAGEHVSDLSMDLEGATRLAGKILANVARVHPNE